MSGEYAAAGSFDGALGRLEEAYRVLRREESRQVLVARDTFDGLLHAAGISLLLADEDPVPAEARAAAGRRALLELARVEVLRRSLALLDELDKTVVRLDWLEPRGLEPRVVVHPLRGYEREAERVVALLDLTPVERTLGDAAILAAGGRPEGVSAKVSVPLEGEDPAAVAVARVLGALWTVVEANWEGTVADVDVEFLHDLRVCLRKTRAVIKEFPGVLDPEERTRWRAELKWLQGVTGEVRDLDVNLEDFDELAALVGATDRAALEPVREVLDQRRAAARRVMVRELRGPRATALRRDWPAFLERLGDATTAPDAPRPIAAVSGARIEKVYRRMVKAGGLLGPGSPAEGYHELRKQGKELRYLLELFGAPLHDASLVKPMTRALKDLQDVLGRHQDREVQAATLRTLAPAVAARPGGPEALIAIGALVVALGEDERAARGEFAEAFAGFAAKGQRRLVRETFGDR